MDVNEGMQVGDVLNGRYRIAREGTLQDIGTRYEGYDLRTGRTVVVFVLASRYGSDADGVRRLMKTQQALTELDTPELVPVEDAGVAGSRLYLVRRLVDGESLADLQSRMGYLSSDVAVQIATRLCDALAPLHRAGLVHGCLSPYSVFIDDAGQVLVTDVGLLPALRSSFAEPGQPWGRVPYLSPEQAAGENAFASSDVYVVGSLLYKMLTGRPPFQAKDEGVLVVRHLRHEPPSLQVLVPDLPPRLAEIVQKCMAKERSARYRNAGQLASILRSQVDMDQPAAILPPSVPRASATPSSAPSTSAHSSSRVTPSPPHTSATPSPAPRASSTSSPVTPAKAGVQARQRLVVPAPPIGEIYPPDAEPQDWPEEPVTADWLMVALVIAALIAVLGLIPLWRTVYRRYAAPPTTSPPALYQPLQRDAADWAWLSSSPVGSAVVATQRSKLDDFGLVWYNLAIPDPSSFWTHNSGSARAGRWKASINSSVWEPRLRDLGASSDIL
jgi:serine/threonine protein kinase